MFWAKSLHQYANRPVNHNLQQRKHARVWQVCLPSTSAIYHLAQRTEGDGNVIGLVGLWS